MPLLGESEKLGQLSRSCLKLNFAEGAPTLSVLSCYLSGGLYVEIELNCLSSTVTF